MKVSTFLILGVTLGTLSRAADIIELSSNNFEDFMNRHELVLVEFVSPTCPACAELEDEFREAASILSQRNVSTAKINCNGQVMVYDGPRTASDMVAYITKRSLPLLSEITQQSLKDFKFYSEPSIIAFWEENGNSDCFEFEETFTTVAKRMDRNYPYLFGTTKDANLAKAEGVTCPSIVLYKPYDEKKVVYEGSLNNEDVINLWIRRNALPLIAEVKNGPDHSKYLETGLPVVNVFFDSPDQHQRFTLEFTPLAKRYREELIFTTRSIPGYSRMAKYLGLKDGPWPAVGIEDGMTKFNMAMNQEKEVNEEELRKFFDNYIAELDKKRDQEKNRETVDERDTEKASSDKKLYDEL